MQSPFRVINATDPCFQIPGRFQNLRRCDKIAVIGEMNIQKRRRGRYYDNKVSLTFYIVAINPFSMEHE
jgi:hypothetical protein